MDLDIIEVIRQSRIVPVVVIDRVEDARPLAEAMLRGGINIAEITFRTDAAASAIAEIASEVPDMVIGAGTVLTIGQADSAIASGARFIVSPGCNPTVIKHCIDRGITMIPGCATPSDIERSLELGINTVKFFPAEAAGGVNYIKAISAPYTGVRFMPTGGINASNIRAYLDLDSVIACGGSWMVAKNLISDGNFDEITRLCRRVVDIVRG